MFLKILNSKKEKVLGIDISPVGLCFSYAEESNDVLELKDYSNLNFDEEIIKNGNIIDEEKIFGLLDEFVQKNSLKKTNIKISISSNDAYIKKITLPDLPESEMSLVVFQEIEKSLPISVNELYIDFNVIRHYVDSLDHNRKADVIYVAAQKSVVQSFINLVEKTGLKVSAVEISVFSALKNLINAEVSSFENTNSVAVFMDYENTDIVFLKDSIPFEIKSVPFGRKEINGLYNEISSASELEKEVFIDKLQMIVDDISVEISNIMQEFYSQNNEEKPVEKLFVLSRDEIKDRFLTYLSEKTGILSVENYTGGIKELIVSSGLIIENDIPLLNLNILDGISSQMLSSVEFLNKEDKKKLLMVYGIYAAVFLVTFCVWGYLFISTYNTKSQNAVLEKEYNQMRPRLERVYAQSEGLKDKKEITRYKLLAKDIVEKDIIPWYSILTDISSVVPKDVKVKEIMKSDKRGTEQMVVISGRIDAAKPEPLKYISFFALNMNQNLPDSTKLTDASVKDVNFNELENYYEFSITTAIKK